MNSILDLIIYILILGVFPLVFCVFCFRWLIALSTNFGIVKSMGIACALSGISFLVFQIGQSFLVVVWGYINYGFTFGFSDFDFYRLLKEIYDLVLDSGLVYSWTAVTHALFPGSFIDKWEYQHLWQVELIYIIFYTILGAMTVVGAKLWKRDSTIKFVGLIILIVCFVLYTFGIYFWMATAMYL